MAANPPIKVPKIKLPGYRLHKPSGRAVVRLGGRDFYLGKYGSRESQEKYAQVCADWLKASAVASAAVRADSNPAAAARAAAAKMSLGAPDDITIAEVCVQYLVHVDAWHPKRSDGSPSSEPAAVRAALRPLVDHFGRTRAMGFAAPELQTIQTQMVALGWCRNNVNRQIVRIKAFFKWAKNEMIVPPRPPEGQPMRFGPYEAIRDFPPLRRGRTEARESERVIPAPQAAIDAVREVVSRPVRAMIDLQLCTGMRPGEVCMMRGIDIRRDGMKWAYLPPLHKTAHRGHVRRIPLGPKAREIVKEFLGINLAAPLFCPREAEIARNEKRRLQRKTPLTPSAMLRRRRNDPAGNAGDKYDVATYRRAITRGCDLAFPPPATIARRDGETRQAWRARLTPDERKQLAAWSREHHWHPHQLRHNAATRIRAEFGLDEARAILGHRSAAVTEIYAERDAGLAEKIMEQIG